MYDIAIVGAGPAGSSLASLIGNKYKVALIDRREAEENSIQFREGKCCGGLLAPDAQRIIASSGLVVPQSIFVGPQLFAVRAIDFDNGLENMYQRFYLNIDRKEFDKWLLRRASVVCDIKLGTLVRDIHRVDNGYELICSSVTGEEKIRARIIVGADGAASIIRSRIFGALAKIKKYAAIQDWYEADFEMPYYTAIFDKEVTDFYSWIIPKEGKLLIGSALAIKDKPKERFLILKDKMRSKGFDLGKKIKSEGTLINRPSNPGETTFGRDGVLLIGEVAGAISPSSAEGISYALRTAEMAYESIAEGFTGCAERYSRRAWKIKLNILLKNIKSPGMYDPFIRKAVIKSGIISIK